MGPSPRQRRSASLALASVLALLASLLTGALVSPASAAASLTLTKEGPGSVLVGESAEFTLTVRNSGDAAAYNVSFRDVLPANVMYLGPTSPASAGAPTVIANAPSTGSTTLIWANTFDLNPEGVATLTYTVVPDPVLLPVGASFVNSSGAYWSSNPRIVPAFNPVTGAFIPESPPPSATSGVAGVTATTTISAVKIEKSEASPENELVRGIHGGNGTIYTLTITNNGEHPTTASTPATPGDPSVPVTVTDYLPASLEFLQCGGVDNTGGPSGTFEEYTGSGRIGVGQSPITGCPVPTSVQTVENPAGLTAGVYTKVTWTLPDLTAAAPGNSYVIRYRAGVPLQANTTSFVARPAATALDPQPAGDCAAGVCTQAANLDNNTGGSTSELAKPADEVSLTNHAAVSGEYQGEWQNPTTAVIEPAPVAVSDSTTETVTIEDLAMQKSVTPRAFAIGGMATYAVSLQTSEYRDSRSITITDVLPDGLTYTGLVADGAAAFVSAVRNATTGDTTLTFTIAGIRAIDGTPSPAGTAQFRYTATMDAAFVGTDVGLGTPTAAGDSYTNRISLTGTTTPIPNEGVAPPDPAGGVTVGDTSSATITSNAASIDKRIGASRATVACDTRSDYVDTTAPAYAQAGPFQVGDTICFRLTVSFPAGNNTKSPFVDDFLPAQLTYVPGSAAKTAADTLLESTYEPDSQGGVLTWTLGTPTPDSGDPEFVLPGEVFQVTFAATVTSAIVDKDIDVTGNLMKFGSVNTAGQATTERDQVDFNLAGSQVTVLKGVVAPTASAVSPCPAVDGTTLVDGACVKAGDAVTFNVNVTNAGTVPVRNPRVTDALYDGITCAQVTSVSDGGTCAPATATAISWVIADDVPIPSTGSAAERTRTLSYVVTIPGDVSANRRFDDSVFVDSYESESNSSIWLRVTLPTGDSCVLPSLLVCDPSHVITRNVGLTKTSVTGFVDVPNNNDLASQVTVGETVTYTVAGTVPAGTTVFNGTVTDVLAPGLKYLSSSATTGTITEPAIGSNPLASPGQTATLTLAPTYPADAPAATDTTFTWTITALVLDAAGITPTPKVHGNTLGNTATFAGDNFSRSQTKNVTIVLPVPAVAKSNLPAGVRKPGDVIEYTVTVTNPSAGTPLHTALYQSVLTDTVPDNVIVDPTTIAITGLTNGSCAIAGATATGGGTITCGALAESPAAIGPFTLNSGADVTVTYDATIAAGAIGSRVYSNTATLVGVTLPNDAQADRTKLREYTVSDTSTVQTSDGVLDKSVTPATATVGQQTAWTIAWRTGDLAYPDPVVVDTLPTVGGEPALVVGSIAAVVCDPACTGVWTPTTPSGTVRWAYAGTVPANTVVTFGYTATVQGQAGVASGGALVNSATVNSGPAAEASLGIVEPSLVLTKSCDACDPLAEPPTDPAPGEPYVYTVTVTNSGTSDAYNATITDVVPVGVIVDEGTLTDGGACRAGDPCDQVDGGGTIDWPDVGPIAPGGSVTRTYTAMLKPSILPPGRPSAT